MSFQAMNYPDLKRLDDDLHHPIPSDPAFLGALARFARAILADVLPHAREKWEEEQKIETSDEAAGPGDDGVKHD